MNGRARILFFLLAAFAWLVPVQAALPGLQNSLKSPAFLETSAVESAAWELVDVQPYGFTEEGTPLALFVFIELPSSFDMFAPVSTRAGPEVHTRVLYVVQPVLGLDTIRTSADGGVWYGIDGTDRELYIGVAGLKTRFFGLSTSLTDDVQLNPSVGGGNVSLKQLKRLAKKNFVGHEVIAGYKLPYSPSSQDSQIRSLIKGNLSPHGETYLRANTRMSREEHEYRSNRALMTNGLLLGSSLSGYTDEGAQIAEFNANLYTRTMLPSAVGPRVATTIFAAESGYILGNPDSTALDRGLAAFDLGLMFISLPGNPNRLATGTDEAVFWSGIGRGGDKRAAAWVAQNGGATLETTLASRGIDLPTWNAADPSVVAAWRQASIDFASGASGNVRVLQGTSLRMDAIFRSEFEALIANPKVRSIMSINPETGLETLLWSR
jgi:hypothetical protein